MSRFLTLIAVALFALPASAHEGEDHGAPAPAALPVAESGVRAEAATELFELVAVGSGDHLTLYVDRFATNEPVSGGKIEVETGEFQAVAEELEAGVYQVIAGELAQPGAHALMVAIQAGDDVDLLSLTVEGAQTIADTTGQTPGLSASQFPGWGHPLVWGTSGAVLLAGAGVVAIRRKGTVTVSDREAKK